MIDVTSEELNGLNYGSFSDEIIIHIKEAIVLLHNIELSENSKYSEQNKDSITINGNFGKKDRYYVITFNHNSNVFDKQLLEYRLYEGKPNGTMYGIYTGKARDPEIEDWHIIEGRIYIPYHIDL
jgi:hypothetical protein